MSSVDNDLVPQISNAVGNQTSKHSIDLQPTVNNISVNILRQRSNIATIRFIRFQDYVM